MLPAARLDLPRRPGEGPADRDKVLDSFPSCPIPEVARLGHTLPHLASQVLAYDTSGVCNGGNKVINLIIEKVRRLAHGFRDFDHHSFERCSPPAADDSTRTDHPMLNFEDLQYRIQQTW